MDPDLPSIMVADVVRSLAGRDKDKLFFVIGVDDQNLILANGKDRTLEKPKTKKRKHAVKVLCPQTRVADKIRNGDIIHNNELRKDLAYLSQQMQSIDL